VSGTLSFNFLASGTEISQPVDLTSLPLVALIPPAFNSIPAATMANGTFTIEGVPTGTYYLKAGNSQYFVLSADTVDLSFDVLSKPTATFATMPTNLTLNITGLAAWQTTDELALFCPQTGTAAYSMQLSASAGVPAANDTSVTGLVYNLSGADERALIDTTAGDQAFITQLATQTDGTRSYTTIARTFSPSPLTITNGSPVTIAGAFATPTSNATLTTVWDRPAFATEVLAHAPGFASKNWSTFALTALPLGSTHGRYGEGPDIIVYAPGYTNDSSTLTTSWAYADPYAAGWTRFVFLRFYQYRYVQMGSATPAAVFAELVDSRDLASISGPIEPLIGFPQNPKLNGMDISGSAPVSNIGTGALLSWDPPAIGTASRYYVRVRALLVSQGATTFNTIATLETASTQLELPPNTLITGQTYVIDIAARSAAGVDLAAKPDAYGVPDATASMVTTTVMP
jgi:hypothetical protein